MKEASLRELQHHLSDIMQYVEHGESVLIRRRQKVIARLVPEASQKAAVRWPDFFRRACRLFPKPVGSPPSEIALRSREADD